MSIVHIVNLDYDGPLCMRGSGVKKEALHAQEARSAMLLFRLLNGNAAICSTDASARLIEGKNSCVDIDVADL